MPITARYINLAQIERLDDRSNEHYITAAVYRQSTVPLFFLRWSSPLNLAITELSQPNRVQTYKHEIDYRR